MSRTLCVRTLLFCASMLCVSMFCVTNIARAQARAVPVSVSVKVDTSRVATTGRAVATLEFSPREDVRQAFAVRLDLRYGRRVVLRRDHSPEVPTLRWKKGVVIRYELSLFFPVDWDPATAGGDDRELEVCVGFIQPVDEKIAPPMGGRRMHDETIRVSSCPTPGRLVTFNGQSVDAAIEAALMDASAKRAAAAWDRLEFAFRRVESYPLKAKIRNALMKVGRFTPPVLDFEEERIVRRRIAAERRRYLRQIAGRMFDRGECHGALLILDDVGGELKEQADIAVLGDLGDAKRIGKRREDVIKKIFARVTAAEKSEAAKLLEKLGESKRLLDHAQGLKSKKSFSLAREILNRLVRCRSVALSSAAEKLRLELDAEWLADVPAAEREKAQAAMQHACWSRTTTRVTHRFIFIGPTTLLAGIDATSQLRFDVAYLYITDLFGRVPNPQGDRVTVYFKELWEFGGGVGGGKIIDIGRADPAKRKTRVDGGLFYHEFTHCVDDTRPIYKGLREGLADFGAAFAYEGLGQRSAALLAFGRARRAFLEDYIQRDLEYWRIANYGPSAGFLLHFIDKYGKAGSRTSTDASAKAAKSSGGHRWELYRRFFRSYRSCRVRDSRLPNIARAFAHHLVEVFGDGAFADLIRFRWPLIASDLQAIRREHVAARDGRSADGASFSGLPGSPVPRDLDASELVRGQAGGERYARELGVIRDWRVIGPFQLAGSDPHCAVFPPEREVDFDKEYPVRFNVAKWRSPGAKPPVQMSQTGWLKFTYPYQENTAIYALTHVSVPQACRALFHLRADDDLSLFVGDALVGKVIGPNPRQSGPWRPSSGTMLSDAMQFEVALRAGRNKVLVKVRNRAGVAGCGLSVTGLDGKPLQGLTSDARAPQSKSTMIPFAATKTWKELTRLRFQGRRDLSKFKTKVGSFTVRNKAMFGVRTDRGVQWRKYTVRPGFPKDSPSNLAWLDERLTKRLDAFELEVGLQRKGTAPKICVIFQGDGGRDALPGWTLILEPSGKQVRVRLERYDRLVYQSGWFEPTAKSVPAKSPLLLKLHYEKRRLTVRLGDVEVFAQVPLRPIPGKHRIGIATWGPDTQLKLFRLRAPKR